MLLEEALLLLQHGVEPKAKIGCPDCTGCLGQTQAHATWIS
jgi:hypothetical protein